LTKLALHARISSDSCTLSVQCNDCVASLRTDESQQLLALMLVVLFVVRPLCTQLTSAADAQIRGTLAALQETEQRATIAVELLQGLNPATATADDAAASSATDSSTASSNDVAGQLFSALLMRHLALRSSSAQQQAATTPTAAAAADANTHLVELEEQCVMIIVAVLGEKVSLRYYVYDLSVYAVQQQWSQYAALH
jgi:hypothetical protein